MLDWLANPEIWIALGTLTALEIVLGIDNIVFIAILAGKLPPDQRDRARRLGIIAAVISRLVLLFGITWVMHLKTPLMTILEHNISGKDLILITGGMFLLAKATYEIHHKVRHGFEPSAADVPSHLTLRRVLVQIMILDMVFSLDSVITAVGLVDHIAIMIAAVLTSVGVMLLLSKAIITFIEANPTIKMLALAFLVLIGALLVAEGFHQHIGKGYVYFAMAFSISVEVLQMLADKKRPKDPGKSVTA